MHTVRKLHSRLPRPTIEELYKSLFPSQLSVCHQARKATTPLSSTTSARQFYTRSRNSQFYLSRNVPHFSRTISTTAVRNNAAKPKTHDRGPPSSETTQTDFSALDVLGATPAPSTSIDACLWDGFHLNSGVKIVGGKGVLLAGGEAFAWRPWKENSGFVNQKGQFEVDDEAWGVLALMWPKPGLLCPSSSHPPKIRRLTSDNQIY